MTNHTHQQHTHRLHAHDTNTNNNTNNTTNHRRPMSDCLHTMAMCSRSSHQNASVRRARRSGAFQVSFTLSFSSLILLLLLQLLTPSSPSSSSSSSLLFVSGLDSDELAAARAGLYSIHIATAPAATQLIRQTTAAYELEQTFDAHTEPMSSTSALLPAHLSGQYDLTVAISALSSSQLQATPQHYYFPLIGNAIVPIYNLPSLPSGTQLILPIQTICDIERGNLTNWNDARIQSANPDLTMPDLGITVYHLSIVTSNNDGITGICNKLDPIFAAEIPRSAGPTWPTSKYFAYGSGANSDLVSSMVVDQPGAFAMCTLQNVKAVKAKVAAIRNYAGVVLQPTINAISLNLLELAVDPLPAGATNHDLAGPKSPNAWPICTVSYVWIDTLNPVSTCSTKRVVLSYLLWLFSSSTVKLLAEELGVAIVPDLFLTHTNLLTDMRQRITCDGLQLISTTSSTGSVEGFTAGSVLLGSFFNYYQDIVKDRTYEFRENTEKNAIQRVVANEIDLALVNGRQLTTDDINLLTSDGAGYFVPAFFTGVAITFSLPNTLTSQWSSWTSSSGLPALYPLSIDLETVAQIFTGQIRTWLHPRILETSPQLEAWFTKYPSADPHFHIVVCCSLTSDQAVAGTLLLQNLNETSTAKSSNFSNYFQLPLKWSDELATSTIFSLIESESRMVAKSLSIAAQGGSTIGYKLITLSTTDPTTEFQIVQYVNGIKDVVKPEPSNFKPCAQSGYNMGTMHLPGYIPEPTLGCYPIATPLLFAVNVVYEGTEDCERGNKSLNLFNWIVNTNSLSGAALNSGAYRIADLSGPYLDTMTVLNGATCDGETLLITLPKVWSTNSGVLGFGWAVMSIDLVIICVSAILLFVYRTRTVLRSSSVPFLGVTLIGMLFLILALVLWTESVTHQSCEAFMWLASLGFSLIFVPFFAKTYRIWAIFSRKQLKVVKMSNKKLLIGVGSTILIEVAFMIVWSQNDPLQPVEYLRNVSGRMHQATHCSVKGNGMTFVVIEAVYKGLLLIVGTMLAFSTRKVSSAFNESSAIAWSIYNVLFSSILIGAIIYFVDAFEDTLILLLLFLIAWIVFVTWCLLFGSKFYALFAHSEADAALASKLSSMRQEKSGGFSFISVLAMSATMLKSYITALEGQIAKARKHLGASIGPNGVGVAGSDGTGGVGLGHKHRVIRALRSHDGGGVGGPTSPSSGLNDSGEDGSGSPRAIAYDATNPSTPSASPTASATTGGGGGFDTATTSQVTPLLIRNASSTSMTLTSIPTSTNLHRPPLAPSSKYVVAPSESSSQSTVPPPPNESNLQPTLVSRTSASFIAANAISPLAAIEENVDAD